MRAFVFMAEGEMLAVPIEDMVGLCSKARITRVPLAPPNLVGITLRQGAVVPIVRSSNLEISGDCRDTEGEQADLIVLERNRVQIALVVDSVMGIRDADPCAETTGDPARFRAEGLEQEALLLDTGALIERHVEVVARCFETRPNGRARFPEGDEP